MENVKHGTTISRYTKVDGDTVHKHHVTLNKTTKSMYELDWYFDFTDVSHDELLELASRDLVIKHRPQFKSAPVDALESWAKRTFSVREFLNRENRSKLSPDERAHRAIDKLDDAGKQRMIDKLQADLIGE